MGIHDDIPHHDAIPDMPTDPYEWLDVALNRLAVEIECCQQHFSDGELGNIVMHMASLMEGTKLTYAHAFEMMDEDTRQAVIRAMIEIQSGMPVANITLVHTDENGSGYLVKLDKMDVPDDLTGLETESGDNDGEPK